VIYSFICWILKSYLKLSDQYTQLIWLPRRGVSWGQNKRWYFLLCIKIWKWKSFEGHRNKILKVKMQIRYNWVCSEEILCGATYLMLQIYNAVKLCIQWLWRTQERTRHWNVVTRDICCWEYRNLKNKYLLIKVTLSHIKTFI
jgi:hypothetical protein